MSTRRIRICLRPVELFKRILLDSLYTQRLCKRVILAMLIVLSLLLSDTLSNIVKFITEQFNQSCLYFKQYLYCLVSWVKSRYMQVRLLLSTSNHFVNLILHSLFSISLYYIVFKILDSENLALFDIIYFPIQYKRTSSYISRCPQGCIRSDSAD